MRHASPVGDPRVCQDTERPNSKPVHVAATRINSLWGNFDTRDAPHLAVTVCTLRARSFTNGTTYSKSERRVLLLSIRPSQLASPTTGSPHEQIWSAGDTGCSATVSRCGYAGQAASRNTATQLNCAGAGPSQIFARIHAGEDVIPEQTPPPVDRCRGARRRGSRIHSSSSQIRHHNFALLEDANTWVHSSDRRPRDTFVRPYAVTSVTVAEAARRIAANLEQEAHTTSSANCDALHTHTPTANAHRCRGSTARVSE